MDMVSRLMKPINLIEINGVVDENDYDHVVRLGHTIVEARPAPKKGDKINPHCSRFILSNGQVADVFHVKPIYYADKNENWRPMSEIADEFGNHYIKLKADWKTKMHPKFLRWISKRMELLNVGKPDDLVVERNEDKTPKKVVPRGLSEKVGQAHVKMPPQAIEALLNNPNW